MTLKNHLSQKQTLTPTTCKIVAIASFFIQQEKVINEKTDVYQYINLFDGVRKICEDDGRLISFDKKRKISYNILKEKNYDLP